MKNISVGLNVVLIIAVGFLYYLHFSDKKCQKSDDKKNTAAITSTGNMKIAYVNGDSLLKEYVYYKDIKELLGKKRQEKEGALQQKQAAFEKEYASFQEKMAKHLVTQREGEELQTRLGKQQQALMQYKEQLSSQMMEEEQQMQKNLQDSILSFMKFYNKEFNYNYILSTAGSILYGAENQDVTKNVIEGLNKRYSGKDKK